MARGDEFEAGKRNPVVWPISQMDGAGDDEYWRKTTVKKKTPKKGAPKKGSGDTNYSPRTPSKRRGRGGGQGAANLAATPGRSTRRSTTNIFEARYIGTTVEDGHAGPPAAAYATLRLKGSIPFKAALHRLADASQRIVLARLSSLDPPQLTGPAQELYAARVHEESPVDSGIDILTPPPEPAPSLIGIQQVEHQVEEMAPVRETSQAERDRLRERAQQSEAVSDSLKRVIQDYYEVQVQVQGYVSATETRDVLVNKVHEISQSLSHLARESSNNTIANTFVPPEVVNYLDDGRNPDIYTRDLVEVVQRSNAVLNGKMNAFGSFSKIFADDLRKMSPEMAKAVDEIMNGSGNGAEVEVEAETRQENGDQHQA